MLKSFPFLRMLMEKMGDVKVVSVFVASIMEKS